MSGYAAERTARGELDPTTRATRELVNHGEALDLLLALPRRRPACWGSPGTGIEPRHEGAFRDGVALVPDPLGNVLHAGPPTGDVEDRVEGLCR